MGGNLTISIDVELAWGNWDDVNGDILQRVEALERPIVRRLIELFDRREVPATWAMVAALADRASADGMPGTPAHWYAPELFEWVQRARIPHEIGSHGGRHRYFDGLSEAEAREDIMFARDIHDRNGFGWGSMVFPRNRIGHHRLLREAGVTVYRGTDWAWHEEVRRRNVTLGRVANLVDKVVPIAPTPVSPRRSEGMVDLSGSLLFMGRNGIRRFVSPKVMLAKLRRGLDGAERSGGTFHLWFHPSNFYHRPDEQFETFGAFLEEVAERRERGRITVRTMSDFA